MALHDDLLAQARLFSSLDPGVPSQANLRRAVSSAYYALFHLLIAETTARLIPSSPRGLSQRVGRSFSHGEMNQACLKFASTRLSGALEELLPSGASTSLQLVAKTFRSLKEWRHYIDDAERAFAAWQSIRLTDEANVFLTALAFGARWFR